jgi:hypothetical protein
MSAKILMGPGENSMDIWKGHAAVDQTGVELAVEMLDELEDPKADDECVALGDLCCLEDWPRHGRPFRNIVAEYLARARTAGPDVEAGFCAVLSDYVSLGGPGSGGSAERYAEMFGIE